MVFMSDSHLTPVEAPKPEQAKKRFEIGNLSQIVSALSSVIVACTAIYVLFFSSTSQMFIAYLHSELALRNSKIAAMELQEHQLRIQISQRETELRTIEQKITELGSNLSRSEFERVREKIKAELFGSKLVVVWPLKLVDEYFSKNGIRPRKEFLLPQYLAYATTRIEQFPKAEQELAQQTLRLFGEQCAHLNKAIDLPALKHPDIDVDAYLGNADSKKHLANYKKLENDAESKFKVLSNRIFDAQRELGKCLGGVLPAT
jgi:hypothetical protein